MRIDSSNFDSEIKKILNEVIPSCHTVYIRVGYFYFSGFSLIAEALENKKVKVLVGMSPDKTITNLIKKSKEEIKKSYIEQLIKNVDENAILDNYSEQKSFYIFQKKIKDGSLEIRQQIEADHAKEYIFELKEEFSKALQIKGITLSGSSNFSNSGFITQAELNHLFYDKFEYDAAIEAFNKKWNDSCSVPLINSANFDEFQKYTSKFHFNQKPSPYLLFVRVLDEYFKERSDSNITFAKEITGEFEDFKYQKDAVTKGLDIIKQHNGVLIADVVGLGKSIVASAIAYNLDLPTYVICPPHLKSQWEDYLFKFKQSFKIFTTGKIDDAINDAFQGQKLIIIDEVHKFRNDETRDYLKLYQLCHGSLSGKPNKILLLSATPFNNKPKDTFSLLKLFQIPTRSTIQRINNLSEYFDNLTQKYNSLQREEIAGKRSKSEIYDDFSRIGEKIRELLTPVMIRRSRIDLENIKRYKEDLEKLKIEFPKVNDPVLLEYDLGSIKEVYIKTLDLISPTSIDKKYNCARYKPISYVKPEFIDEITSRGDYNNEDGTTRLPSAQQNIADFIKRLLVRRFESSSYSFLKTLNTIISSNEMVIKYYESFNFIPVYRKGELPDYEELFDLGSTDNQQMFDIDPLNDEDLSKLPKLKELQEKGVWFIKKEELKENYISDVKNDLNILREIKKDWEIISSKDYLDPKIEEFKKIIKKMLIDEKSRKIIVFTEFSDTAEFLYSKLKDSSFRVFKYTSAESGSKEAKNIVKINFDASSLIQKNDYDILVATDAISEGFNLHRAGSIFNFDIPYNPTRVVQRFGRINRINKKVFDILYIYNFFPTEIGERETGIRRITDLKKMMFNSIFGDDTRTLNKYEDLQSYFIDSFKNLNQEKLSPESYFENIIFDLRQYNEKIITEAASISKRVKIKRETKNVNGLMVFSKKGDVPKFLFMNNDNTLNNELTDIDFLKLFEANINEKHKNFDNKFEENYENLKRILFKDNLASLPNKNKIKIINKLELVLQNTKYKEYFENVLKVVRDLDSLTPYQLKFLKDTSIKNFDTKIELFFELIPKYLLKSLIDNYEDIKLKKEALIITEQFDA
jgi:superfamily II DNA/RNA helicase